MKIGPFLGVASTNSRTLLKRRLIELQERQTYRAHVVESLCTPEKEE
jgi:hypothetical protein